jgi:hypothetical protein
MKTTLALVTVLFTILSGDSWAQTRSTLMGQFGSLTMISSSTLVPQSGNSYAPLNVMDGDQRTVWVEGAAGDG